MIFEWTPEESKQCCGISSEIEKEDCGEIT